MCPVLYAQFDTCNSAPGLFFSDTVMPGEPLEGTHATVSGRCSVLRESAVFDMHGIVTENPSEDLTHGNDKKILLVLQNYSITTWHGLYQNTIA